MSLSRRRGPMLLLRRQLCLGAAALLCSCSAEPRRVELVLRGLVEETVVQSPQAGKARRARVERALQRALPPHFDLLIPWEGGGRLSRMQLLDLLLALEPANLPKSVVLSSMNVALTEAGDIAVASGDARWSTSQPGDLHALRQRYEVTLAKLDGRWKVQRLILESPATDLPEARP